MTIIPPLYTVRYNIWSVFLRHARVPDQQIFQCISDIVLIWQTPPIPAVTLAMGIMLHSPDERIYEFQGFFFAWGSNPTAAHIYLLKNQVHFKVEKIGVEKEYK